MVRRKSVVNWWWGCLVISKLDFGRVAKRLPSSTRMEKKLKEEFKDQGSENRFEEFKKLLKTAKARITTSSSKPNGPPDSPHNTPTQPPLPLPPLPLTPPATAGPKDEVQKRRRAAKETEKEVKKSKKGD